MSRLSDSPLKYQWTMAYEKAGGQATRLFTRKIIVNRKPVLVFCNGEYTGAWYADVARSDGNDKSHHKWGQSLSGMHDLMRQFVQPGQLVVDPFLGGGTTAVAALSLGAKFLGCDIDQAAIDTTKTRLANPPSKMERPLSPINDWAGLNASYQVRPRMPPMEADGTVSFQIGALLRRSTNWPTTVLLPG